MKKFSALLLGILSTISAAQLKVPSDGSVIYQDTKFMPIVGLHSSGQFIPMQVNASGELETTGSDSPYSPISTQSKVPSTGALMIDTGDGIGIRGAPLIGLDPDGNLVPIAVDGDGKMMTVGGGGGGGSGITSLNGISVASQTFLAGVTGADFNIASSGSQHRFNIPTASSTVRGALSATDWTTFNAKVSSAQLNGVSVALQAQINGVTVTWPLNSPNSTSPQYRTGGDDDSGVGGTGDGSVWLMANGFKRVNVQQNFTEFLGPVTANSNMDIAGTLTVGAFDVPAGSVDLTTDVTGVLPIANGGTGASSWGPFGTIPFQGSGGTLETDWSSLNYNSANKQLTVPQIFSNLTINSVTSAVVYESARFQPTLSGTFLYITPGIVVGATLQGVSLANAAQSFDFSNTYTGANSLPNGVIDFNIHHNFQNNTTNLGPFKSFAFNNSFNDHDSITLVDSNNIVGVTSNVGNYKVLDAHDQFLAGSTVNNYSSVNTNASFYGGLGNYIGINDQPTFYVSPSSYIGINISAQGGVTVSDPIALNLSSDNLYSSTAFVRPKAMQHNGKGVIAFTTVTTLPNSHPSVVDSVNNMISAVVVPVGSPLSGTGSLGWNFGGFIDAQANVSLDPIAAGINAAGWVSLVGISSGVTVAQAGGTISVPVNASGISSGATGGHLGAYKHYQAFPFFPGGGSNTLGDMVGFGIPSGFCTGPSGVCRGFDFQDPGSESYTAGSIVADGDVSFGSVYADPNAEVVTPSAAFSNTISSSLQRYIIAPTTTIAAATVTMPSSPINGQLLTIACNDNDVTSLTHLPNSGQTLKHALTGCTVTQSGEWIFKTSGSTWWRTR